MDLVYDSSRLSLSTERECLKSLRGYDTGAVHLADVLDILARYEKITASTTSYLPQYTRTLESSPWKRCPCSLCREHGIEMVIFRGTERNKRRGFHNLSVFAARIRELPSLPDGPT